MPGALLHPFAKPTRESFIPIVGGDGALIHTKDGRSLIDGMSSLWYCAIGHGRKEMAEAIYQQASTLACYSIFDPFTNEPAEALAERLRAIGPIPDARIFLTCSGSEAIDSVMKLTRMAHVQAGNPEKSIILSRGRGYHGTNYGGTSAQGIPLNKENFGPFVGGVEQVPADDLEALSVLMSTRGHEIAGIITEPVQGAGGIHPTDVEYLRGLRKVCDQHGAYLIFDEVITGFGRLGTWFGAQDYGVVPDLVTFAKGVTSGYQPVGGVFLGPKPMAALEANPDFFLRHGYTYSGHPTACAAALKNLEIIEREGLLDRAPKLGQRLSNGLQSLVDDGDIASIRGRGAMWAALMRPDQSAAALRDHMLEHSNVVCRALADCLCFCPPLVATDEQIDQIVDAVAAAVRATS
ncbi:MAG: aspartate aminotransferase family protein [Ilumatobacteraceae bacterium]